MTKKTNSECDKGSYTSLKREWWVPPVDAANHARSAGGENPRWAACMNLPWRGFLLAPATLKTNHQAPCSMKQPPDLLKQLRKLDAVSDAVGYLGCLVYLVYFLYVQFGFRFRVIFCCHHQTCLEGIARIKACYLI